MAAMGSVSGEISKDMFHLWVPWEEKVIRAVKGEARDKAAAAVGWSGRTLQDARRVVAR